MEVLDPKQTDGKSYYVWDHRPTEQDAINAIVAQQKADGEMIDPAGARRLVRALVALGLLKFDA